MEKFRFLKHTADAKFQAFGKTMEEAFANAGLAMLSIIYDADKIKKAKDKNIKIEGKDLKALLYNFLEELLFLLDSENFLLRGIRAMSIKKRDKGFLLSAILEGDDNRDTYELHGDIKAVTYNDMDIKEENQKVIIQVVVDI